MASGAHDLDAHLQLRTDDRGLTGTLRISPQAPIEQINEHALRAFLDANNVSSRSIDGAAIAALVKEVQGATGAEHAMVVAKGREPRDGERQVLEWSEAIGRRIAEIDARREKLVDDETPKPVAPGADAGASAIDFYEQSAFVIVHAGETLGSVTPPDPGEDGEDIFGNSVPARKSPAPSELNPETLQLTSDHRVIALTRGRLIYAGAERTIEQTLHVQGDVGFATGNIDFPGPVEVAGGIKDKFRVKSTGSVSVRKLVEAATVFSKRDVLLDRGVAGRDQAVLEAARHIQSGYMEAVTAVCGEDCVVKHEITNCKVTVRGKVRAPTGAIRGGVINAAKGVEAAVLGSVQEVRTEILVASVPELEALLAQAKERAAEAEAGLQPKIDKQSSFAAATGKPTAKQIEEQMSLDFDVMECQRRLSELRAAIDRLESNRRSLTEVHLKVSQCIYGGVVIWLPGYRVTFRNELKGESQIRLDPNNRVVVDFKGETHPMSRFAHVDPDMRVAPMPRWTGGEQAAA